MRAGTLSPLHTSQHFSPKNTNSHIGENSCPHIPTTPTPIYEPSPTASNSYLHDHSQTKLDITLPTSAVSPSKASLHPLESTRDAGIKVSHNKPSNTTDKLSSHTKPSQPSSNSSKPRENSSTKPPQPQTTSKLATESSLHRVTMHSSFTNDFRNTDNTTNKHNKSNPYRHLPTHLLENLSVDKHYATLTLSILKTLYKKSCDCSNSNLVMFAVKSRPSVARCSNCHKQVSLTSNTPLHKFQLPLSYFSYILHDAILQYPKVVTSAEIGRKLNLPYKTSYLLKRRLQLITSMLTVKMRDSVKAQLKEFVSINPITLPKDEDLRPILNNYPIASFDAVVLYSSSVKANKYRSRRFRTGSSSIYLSNNLGGTQVGSMVHTIGIKGSYTFYKSIPLTKQEYLRDDIDSVIPREIPLFTDEGYKFIWDRKNHRMVNHSRKSKNPRYNMSRERWVTKEGVSSNISEGRNNILKQAFRSYYYVSPKWSQVYLDELSFLGNLRYETGLSNLMFTGSYSGEIVTTDKYTRSQYRSKRELSMSDRAVNTVELEQFVGSGDRKCQEGIFGIHNVYDQFIYKPLSMDERRIISETVLKNEIKTKKRISKLLQSELNRNDEFWNNVKSGFIPKERKRKELKYNLNAKKLWEYVPKQKWINIDHLVSQIGLEKKEIIHIIKQWAIAGLIKVSLGKEHHRISYKIYRKSDELYNFVYSREKFEINRFNSTFNKIVNQRK